MHSRGGCLIVAALVVMAAPAAAVAGDNPFPLGKNSMPSWYKDTAPLPCGITYSYTRMVDDMDVSNVTFAIGGQPLPPGAVSVDNVTHHTNVFMVRFDTWVFPFLNVYGLAAQTHGDAPGVRPVVAPIPGLPPLPATVDVAYNGRLFGIGTTLAGGYKNFYASYDINRQWVRLDLFTERVPAVSQGIRAGLRGKLAGRSNAEFYVGGFHLSLRDAVLAGQNFIPGLPQGTFSLVAKPKSAWNALVGGSIELTRQMVITAEAGFGTRKQFTIMPGVRF